MEAESKELIYLGGDDVNLKYLGGTKYEISGSLILFGDGLKSSDFASDWFADDTDYDLRPDGTGEVTLYYNHGKDPVIGKAKLGNGKAQLTKREKDIWIRHELDKANQYDELVIDLIQERKRLTNRNFGFSSGSPGHLADRKAMVDGSRKVTHWSLSADASVTLIPFDWRQTFVDSGQLEMVSIKSAIDLLNKDTSDLKSPGSQSYTTNISYGDDGKPTINISNTPNPVISSDAEENNEPEAQPEGMMPVSAVSESDSPIADDSNTKAKTQLPKVEVIQMTENTEAPAVENAQGTQAPPADNLKAFEELLQKHMKGVEDRVSAKMEAVTTFIENEPRVNRSGFITVDGGTADQNIKNAADMLLAIKRRDNERLTKHYNLKAQTEGDGTTGGYFVPDQVLSEMFGGLNLTSPLGSLVTRIPVMQPSGEMPIRDYSRTPTANAGNSASAQGLESQARSEGGAYAAETIYFELLQYRVTDATSGYVPVSRELTQDFPAIQGLIRSAVQEDIVSKEEYFILRGNGVNQPLGVINWSGLATHTEATDNTFAVGDSDNMLAKLLVKNPSKVAWVHHPNVMPSIAAFERGTGGSVYQANIPGMLPESLHGYGRFNSQHMFSKNNTNDYYCIIGDWSQYFMFERGGMYLEYSEHADFLNGNNVWRFGKRFDGKPALTSAVTLADGSYTLSPFVAIVDGS